MTNLTLRPADECRSDDLALGEVMLRLDPGELRIRTARSFTAWEGGGEYNVVRGLSRVFGQRAGVITALVDDAAPALEAANEGLGLAYVPEDIAAVPLRDGRLIQVLADWCPPAPGYHLYYPSRRQMAPAFALIVESLRYRR